MVTQPVQRGTIRRLIVTLQGKCAPSEAVTNPYADWCVPPAPVTEKRHYAHQYDKFCCVCGAEFSSPMPFAKCCGVNCRMRLSRSRKAAQKNKDKILWGIGALQDMAECSDPVLVARARQALADLKKDIADACAEMKV